MKDGFLKALLLMMFAVESLKLRIGAELVKYFPHANEWIIAVELLGELFNSREPPTHPSPTHPENLSLW